MIEKDRSGPQVKVLNWDKVKNFDGTKQELVKVDLERLFAGKSLAR